jgi:hypothetical protein
MKRRSAKPWYRRSQMRREGAATIDPMKYSLRSLLIVMLISGPASCFVWNAWQAWHFQQQRASCPGTLRQIGIPLHQLQP